MKLEISLFRRGATVAELVLLSVLMSIGVASQVGLAAGEAGEKPLEAYLKPLGYEPVQYKRELYGSPHVEGRIGSKKLIFLLDTGWGFTAVSPAGALGLKTLGELGVTLEDKLLGPLTNAELVLIEKLVIGQAQFLNQPAQVQKLKFDYIQSPYDGVLGSDFFFRNFCLIDCGRRNIFFRGNQPSEQMKKALAETLRRSGLWTQAAPSA
jgi:hypothetical protein